MLLLLIPTWLTASSGQVLYKWCGEGERLPFRQSAGGWKSNLAQIPASFSSEPTSRCETVTWISTPIIETWSTLKPRQILAPFSLHGPACQPGGERWSPSQALVSGLATSLSVIYWEQSFYDWSTSGLMRCVNMFNIQ